MRRWKKIVESASGRIGHGDLMQRSVICREMDPRKRLKTKYVKCNRGLGL
jgi:hypothetical protein